MSDSPTTSSVGADVLIVEDSPTQAQRLKHILETEGYTVQHATNGRLALELLQTHKPKLIISDIVMPEMDGYELCRQVKSDPRLTQVPVFLVTALSDPQDVIRGLACRADNFIPKPYDERALLSRVRFVLLNNEVQQVERVGMGVELIFNGERHFITSDRLQILHLLLSTYDAAIQRHKELGLAQRELREINLALSKTNRQLAEQVHERELAQQALRDSEENLAVTLQSIGDAVLATDGAARITRLNAVAEALTGWTLADAAGRPVDEVFRIVNAVTRLPAFLPVAETLANGTIQGLANDTILIARDGSECPISDSCAPIRDRNGEVIGAVLVFRDVSAEKRAAREVQELNESLERQVVERTRQLRDSETRFVQLAENSSDIFWFYSVNPPKVLYISPAVERIWGIPPEPFYQDPHLVMRTIHEQDKQRVADAWCKCLRGETPRFEEEFRVITPVGKVLWILGSGTPIRDESGAIVRLSGLARDMTERRQAERLMLRSQRLESIGTLAGGVAHDLNNALTPILMATKLLRNSPPEKFAKYLELIEISAQRGADMVRQLLTFSKGAEGERVLIQSQHLLSEIEKIIVGSFPKNVRLRANLPRDLRPILGDATQLHQVLLNLCVNARDAMPEGGELSLEAENVEVDATYASTMHDGKPGRFVLWRIKDTGTGIPPEIIERIFEPFFSTKGPDKGTGLGLSTVTGIVKSHGGFIHVYSVIGQGTTFSVYLPAVKSGESDIVPTATANDYQGNGETVLVVDDEAPVRDILHSVLTDLNFKAVTAAAGTEALILVAEHRDTLRLVITDLHMPHMDGVTFTRALRHMMPDVAVIVASGRLEEREANEFRKLGVSTLLDKPFTQEQLIDALKAVFNT